MNASTSGTKTHHIRDQYRLFSGGECTEAAAGNADGCTARDAPETASARSLTPRGAGVKVSSTSMTSFLGQGGVGFEDGLAAVREEWDHAVANVRKGNTIDGRVFETLLDAVMTNRENSRRASSRSSSRGRTGRRSRRPSPAVAAVTVHGVSIGAVLVQATAHEPPAGPDSAQARYQEWQ